MSESASKVFLVDDDQDIRSSLARALNKRGFDVDTFESADSFLEAYDGKEPGCLLLDYGMPGMNGLELQTRLNENGWSIPIIFITGHGGVAESVSAMKAGAVDFLEKPFRQSVLIERIEEALKLDQMTRLTDGEIQETKAKFDRLTAREGEIAEFMIANPSSTSSKEIGRALDISPRTVDHHRARILEKLNIKSVVELLDLSKKVSSETPLAQRTDQS